CAPCSAGRGSEFPACDSVNIECYADAKSKYCACLEAVGASCASAANDHAADWASSCIQSACSSTERVCAECWWAKRGFAAGPGPTSTWTANFSTKITSARAWSSTSTASSWRTASDASDAGCTCG